jgi:hypothetical protein
MVYTCVPGANQTTNAGANTANDAAFTKPGTARSSAVKSAFITGKGAGLTTISGIEIRGELWTTTSSSGGTAITPTPADQNMSAASSTAAFSATTVTSGTGGPSLQIAFGCGAAGPGGWVAQDPDSMLVINAAANRSLDWFNISGTISLNFEMSWTIQE